MSTTAYAVAVSVRRALDHRREIVWTPGILRPVFMVLRHLPTRVFRRLPI